MFNKNIIFQSIIFIIVYLLIFVVCIWFYFLAGNNFAEELGLAGKNAALWSRADIISIFSGVGVFLAPVIVLWGFHAWKVQEKLKLRIDALRTFKNYVIEMYVQIYDFQKKGFYNDFRYGKRDLIEENYHSFKNNFSQHILDLFSKINRETAYFDVAELDEIVIYVNKLWIVIKNIHDSKLVVETIELKIPRESLLTGEENEFEKNLYILDPYTTRLKKDLNDPEVYKVLEQFSKDKLFKTLEELNQKIDTLLRDIYK